MTEGYDEAAQRRLADAVRHRRAILGYAMDALPNGPGEVTLRSIEDGSGGNYRPRTLIKLDRSLDWKPGTSQGILDGTVAPPGILDGTAFEPEPAPLPSDVPTSPRLAALLRNAGVGTRWKYRDLEGHSGGTVSRHVWQTMAEDLMYWEPEMVGAAVGTLRALGESMTVEEFERAMFADLRHTFAVRSDPVSELKARSRATRVDAIHELTQSLVADDPTGQPP